MLRKQGRHHHHPRQLTVMSSFGSLPEHSHEHSHSHGSHLSSFDEQLRGSGSQSWTEDSLSRTSFSKRKHVHSVERTIEVQQISKVQKDVRVVWTPLVWKFVLQLGLTVSFFVVELCVGIWIDSLALQADAYHMLGDSLALFIGLYSALNENRPEDSRYTFGYSRWDTVGSLINTSILMFICFDLTVEAISRCFEVEDFKGSLTHHVDKLFIVGGLGLALNICGLVVFSETHEHVHAHCHDHDHDHKHDHGHDHGHEHGHTYGRGRSKILKQTIAGSAQHYVQIEEEIDDFEAFDADHINQFQSRLTSHGTHGPSHSVATNSGITKPLMAPKKHQHRNSHAVYLHVLGDALGSVAVVVSALVIKYLKAWGDNRLLVDPICTMVIACFILMTTLPLFKQNIAVLLQGVPPHIDVDSVRSKLLAIDGVKGIHNLQIWELSARRYIAAVHVVVRKDHALAAITETKLILHEHGVHNTTVQAEYGDATSCWEPICSDENCVLEKLEIVS